jgi:hypothetical protein
MKPRIVAMLRSSAGATVASIMSATDWQQHSVRGFLAGVVRRKLGLNLVSERPPPAHLNRHLLSSIIAYQVHADRSGDLDHETKQLLDRTKAMDSRSAMSVRLIGFDQERQNSRPERHDEIARKSGLLPIKARLRGFGRLNGGRIRARTRDQFTKS